MKKLHQWVGEEETCPKLHPGCSNPKLEGICIKVTFPCGAKGSISHIRMVSPRIVHQNDKPPKCLALKTNIIHSGELTLQGLMCRLTCPRTQNKSSSLKRTYVKKTHLLIIKQLLDRQEPVALLRWKCTEEPFLQFCSTRLMLVLESALLVAAPSNLLAPLGMCQPLHSSHVTAGWVPWPPCMPQQWHCHTW